MTTILVTGANGFIGQNLIAALSSGGYRVRAAVRGPMSRAPLRGSHETVVIGAVGPDTDWNPALDGVDAVVHLAAVAHRIGPERTTAEEYRRVNTIGTARLADAVAASQCVRRLVLMSSIAVTGSHPTGPVSERTPAAPDSSYGDSKYRAELAVAQILAGTASDWSVLRPPLVYGPGNPGNMARLLRLVRLGLPLPLGAATGLRSFLFVGNLVDLIRLSLESPQASRRIFAAADAETISTAGLLELIGRIIDQPVRLFSPYRPLLQGIARIGDGLSRLLGHSVGVDSYSLDRLMGSLVVDSSTATTVLGWKPPYTLTEGLRLSLATA